MNLTIKPKNKTQSYVEINDIQWGILPNKILRFFSLHENNIIEENKQLLLTELEKYAYSKAISYLAQRERSEKEVSFYLYRFSFHQSIIHSVISQLKKQNYLNNERFAELYATDLMNKKKSRREIYHKLIEKGVEKNIIEQTLSAFYTEDKQAQILQELANKAQIKYRNHSQKREKIIAFLYRKGFRYDEIMQVIGDGNNE